MNENIYIVGNLIWIRIETLSVYASKEVRYMLCGRSGGLTLDAVLTKRELQEKYPNGKFLKGINASDTVTFIDK